ncbi:hypothetical protein GPJ56_004171 [Histomonas meleagridis]|uniref:uncharacterized protein n=1 Tax=Histomonas meleagridis TaxID=135588 RepID=UPI00355A457F|nr:hypothetical protein GPJ56_004171 [Histomonas meleagridis]KAH0801513.1 hypothetical protein GO595_005649 [Histomonas meleagridis]
MARGKRKALFVRRKSDNQSTLKASNEEIHDVKRKNTKPSGKNDTKNQVPDLNSINPSDMDNVKHPFEIAGQPIRKLSSVQKAILYCMNLYGGYATDEQVLEFLHKFWDYIVSKAERKITQIPDKRILHVNYSIQKGSRFLFVRSPEDPEKWGPNTPEAPRERSRCIGEPVIPFQKRISTILKTHEEGMTVEELCKALKQYAGSPGMYKNLPYKKRVQACLASKLALQELDCNTDTAKWYLHKEITKNAKTESVKSVMPKALEGIKIKEMTLNKLWDLLKEKHIY